MPQAIAVQVKPGHERVIERGAGTSAMTPCLDRSRPERHERRYRGDEYPGKRRKSSLCDLFD